jgi:hypothetical protein
MKRILNNRIVICLIIGLFLYGCNSDKNASSDGQQQRYTCPMHPQIIKDASGTCPICKMDLVPMHSADAHGAADTSLNYLACVAFQIKSKDKPWYVLKGKSQEYIFNKIKLAIDGTEKTEGLLSQQEIKRKIEEKTEYMLLNPESETSIRRLFGA